MIKPNDKLAPIFRSLHPDESVIAKATSAFAQEAAEKWPLFRVLAPKKPLSTPALSDIDKQNWLSPTVEPLLAHTPTTPTSNLSDKLAEGLSKMANRKKPPPRKPTKEAKTKEQAPITRTKPSVKPSSELLAPNVNEKHTMPVMAPASEFAGKHIVNPLAAEQTLPASSALKPTPPADKSEVLSPVIAETSSAMYDKPVRPKRIRKQGVSTKVQSETTYHEPPLQPIEIVDKTPEPLTPIDPPKSTGSLKSLLNKLQNPANTSTETSTTKAPAFLSRLYKK